MIVVLAPELGRWRRQWRPLMGALEADGWGPQKPGVFPSSYEKNSYPLELKSPHPGISSNNLSLGISQNLCEEKEEQKQQMTQARGLPHWADSNRTCEECRQLSLPFCTTGFYFTHAVSTL